MDLIGNYETKPFTKSRKNTVEILRENEKKHSAYGLIELDITNARNIIKKLKEKHNKNISVTGWIIKCIAEAISKHKELNAYRLGRNKLVIFDDVDILIYIEREIKEELRPLVYIIRKANEKSVFEITNEIRSAQKEKVEPSTQFLGKKLTRSEKFALNTPSFFQRFILWLFRRNGVLKKKYLGTVGVTSVGMIGEFKGWAVPIGGIVATFISIGGIMKKPGINKNKIEIREYLPVTVCTDHAIVDGGPTVRFLETLTKLVESGYELPK